MFRLHRLPRGLVLPALLIGLVALLGTLQYRWLGKVSEAEREGLRRSLEQRAREFAEDFDAEIARLYVALQLPEASLAGDTAGHLAAAVGRWRGQARFPQVVRGLYLVETAEGQQALREFDEQAGTLGPPRSEWPAHLKPARAMLAAGITPPPAPAAGGQARIVAFTLAPLVIDVPALLVPVGDAVLPPDPFRLHGPAAHVLVDIDREALRQVVLPALVTRHFPGEGAGSYRVAVLSAGDEQLFVRGASPKAGVNPAHADVITPFFTLRLDMTRVLRARQGTISFSSRMRENDDGAQPEAAEGQRVAVLVEHRGVPGAKGSAVEQVRIVRPAWRLVLQHSAGSLDAAVSQARRRNLWLGFGILSVLAGGLVLVVVNARRSGRLAARQMEFVASVSHELKTPLTVIRSAAQNLSAGVVSDPVQARRYGELIEGEGRRLTDMVEQILEYSRLDGDRAVRDPRPVDPPTLIQQVAEACRPACADAGVTLEVALPAAPLPAVVGDRAALHRALQNLVANAVKHAAEGGLVRVEAGVETSRGRDELRVDVTDRGPGIPTPDIAHLFEPFYRGRRAIERQVHGNGLGLSLVKRVAEAHRGTVTVRSVVGEGSTFTLRLPLSADASVAAPSPGARSSSNAPSPQEPQL